MKKDLRGNVIELSKKVIPRDEKGDPCFKWLGKGESGFNMFHPFEEIPSDETTILEQFTPQEVVHMVNRYLYQAEYSRTVHRQRARDEAAQQQPLKDKIEELFGCRWTQATDDQILTAMRVLKEERGK